MLQKKVQDRLKWVSIILESLIETYLWPRQYTSMIKIINTYLQCIVMNGNSCKIQNKGVTSLIITKLNSKHDS